MNESTKKNLALAKERVISRQHIKARDTFYSERKSMISSAAASVLIVHKRAIELLADK